MAVAATRAMLIANRPEAVLTMGLMVPSVIALIELADQLEEELPTGAGERQVAELIG
jgi:hypothetical protein